MSGRQPVYKGTNNQGNNYTVYNDGAYRYSNSGQDGGPRGNYYDTGKGHSFYENKTDGYKFHENQNQGFRDYQPSPKKK